MLALARLHLLVNDLDACQQQCSQLLEMDKDNDSAFMVNYIVLFLCIFLQCFLTCRVQFLLHTSCI
jgi:hypothetical protein